MKISLIFSMRDSGKIVKTSLLSLFLLCACNNGNKEQLVKVVLEDGDYSVANQIKEQPKGSDFTFDITLDVNKAIASTTYENYTISENIIENKRYDKITFHQVNYSTFITLYIVDAVKIDYEIDGILFSEYAIKNHERLNTSNDYESFDKEGYCLTGWQKGDEIVSLGSRVDVNEAVRLKARYLKESEKNDFEYEIMDDTHVTIKKYVGEGKTIVLPSKIDGRSTTAIAKDAFADLEIEELVIPRSVGIIANGSFVNCHIKQLVFFDNLSLVSNDSFLDCKIDKVRINAVKSPCYSRNYFGAYPEKFDRLLSLKDKRKIVLYGGSSVRFGFDSELIDQTFTDYEVVDMGVFAYTQGYPQLEVINAFMNEGDVIIATPEFDTLKNQIDLKPLFDESFFAMIEGNYDILSILDISKYQNFFHAFNLYQRYREKLTGFSYPDTAYNYDEDGNYVANHSYNRYGDYIVYRRNNEERRVYGVVPAIFNKTHFSVEMIDNFNNAFSALKNKGVKLIYDYSPRSDLSISEDSSIQSAIELDEYLKANIDMAFISNAEESIIDAYYFYGTDNHLSTEGVGIRTKKVIRTLLDGHYI